MGLLHDTRILIRAIEQAFSLKFHWPVDETLKVRYWGEWVVVVTAAPTHEHDLGWAERFVRAFGPERFGSGEVGFLAREERGRVVFVPACRGTGPTSHQWFEAPSP